MSVSRFWSAKFLFCIENIVLFLRWYWVCTYQKSKSFVPAGTDLAVKLLTWQNRQELKCFWHVSTLFKDLRSVVSIQTNHTFTSLDSIERLLFSYKVFSSLSPWWFFIYGGECCRLIMLRTVQGYFWHSWQRPDAIRVIRPDRWVRSEVLSPTPHQDMRWQSHHIITTSLLGCRTAFPHRCSVLDRPNTSDLMVISMDLFS